MDATTCGRLALAVSACLATNVFAAGPRIEAVMVMDDLDAIGVFGENLPVRPQDLRVQLGTAGEPGDISGSCRAQQPMTRALVCSFGEGGLPPAGDYLLRVGNARSGASVQYGLTIGAVGPQGAAGPAGPAGPPGATNIVATKIAANGDVVSSTRAVASVFQPGPGFYHVELFGPTNDCVFTVSPHRPGDRTATIDNAGGQIDVVTMLGGSPDPSAFTILGFCPD